MASKLAKLEQDTITNSLEIVHHKVRLLMEVWKMFFDEICYLDYLTSLPSSIEQFLGEIYCLTMNFCVRKTQRIRELQTKMFELRRVLSVGSDDPDDDWERGHMSLDRKLTQLQQRINTLTQQLNERKLLMDEYTREEIQLLSDLGEAAPPHEPLCANPDTGVLPDAQKMAQFADYLSRLRAEKVKRIVTRDKLQSEIRKKAQLLDWVPRKDRHRQLINEQTLIPSLSNLNELQHLDFVLSGLLERKQQQEQQQQQQQTQQNAKPLPAKKGKKQQQQQQQQEGQKIEQNKEENPLPADGKERDQPQQKQPPLPSAAATNHATASNSGTPSPPPPPPSPASEVDLSAAGTSTTTAGGTTASSTASATAATGLFEQTIETYMRVEAVLGRPADRDKIIEEIFSRFRASINVWWERCLILPNERQQCKVLYTDQLDEDAFVAHIEQQKLLQSYYHENEAIFRLIYQWADQWNRAVQLQREQTAAEELAVVNERLAAIRKQLESKCREFEQRCQVKFTMYGMPVMQVLQRCQAKGEKLKLPDSCKVKQAAAPPRTATKKGAASAARQQISPETAVELSTMLKDLLSEQQQQHLLGGPIGSEESNHGTDEWQQQQEEADGDDAEVDDDEDDDEDEDEDDDDDEEEEEEEEDDDDEEEEDDEEDDDADGSSSSSDDGGEVNQKRDDELLEEAFASATAAVTTKTRMHSVNGHPAAS
ncbi:nucleoprotein TPR-like [Anopheles merus]|uniref:Protein regulator of cytokinesis 1 n=1 Tax=Anopheles merus TaxID=30066 RepID=A0A182UYC9_ANOME|nr:nucleoprotein TPR-like [Anopheles merus]